MQFVLCELGLLYPTNAGYQVWWERGGGGKVERVQGEANWVALVHAT